MCRKTTAPTTRIFWIAFFLAVFWLLLLSLIIVSKLYSRILARGNVRLPGLVGFSYKSDLPYFFLGQSGAMEKTYLPQTEKLKGSILEKCGANIAVLKLMSFQIKIIQDVRANAIRPYNQSDRLCIKLI